MEKRVVLAVVLSLAVLFGSQWLFQRLGWTSRPVPTETTVLPRDTTSEPGVEATRPAPAAPGTASLTATDTTATVGLWVAPGGVARDSVVQVERPHYTARFRTSGARLLSFVLKDYKDGDNGRATLAADPALAL